MRKIALVDMDDTLVGYSEQMVKDFNSLNSPNDLQQYGLEIFANDENWVKNRMHLIKQQPGWWKNLPRKKEGFEILEILRELNFEINVLTKGPWKNSWAWTEKVKWCRKQLPEDVKITITEDKSLVYGKILVDDYGPYAESWLKWRPRGLVIMPKHWHNEYIEHPNIIHYDNNRDEIIERIKELKF